MTRAENRGEGTHPAASSPPDGPTCCFCGAVTWDGVCWMDPASNAVCACRSCAVWLGEKELGLRP